MIRSYPGKDRLAYPREAGLTPGKDRLAFPGKDRLACPREAGLTPRWKERDLRLVGQTEGIYALPGQARDRLPPCGINYFTRIFWVDYYLWIKYAGSNPSLCAEDDAPITEQMPSWALHSFHTLLNS